ncbi:MAG TPA: hypothetical protein DG942_07480 [Ruminococcaceae bacterium]|nr:hypothetical protein [Oscillospiraceae bacterium]
MYGKLLTTLCTSLVLILSRHPDKVNRKIEDYKIILKYFKNIKNTIDIGNKAAYNKARKKKRDDLKRCGLGLGNSDTGAYR